MLGQDENYKLKYCGGVLAGSVCTVVVGDNKMASWRSLEFLPLGGRTALAGSVIFSINLIFRETYIYICTHTKNEPLSKIAFIGHSFLLKYLLTDSWYMLKQRREFLIYEYLSAAVRQKRHAR